MLYGGGDQRRLPRGRKLVIRHHKAVELSIWAWIFGRFDAGPSISGQGMHPASPRRSDWWSISDRSHLAE